MTVHTNCKIWFSFSAFLMPSSPAHSNLIKYYISLKRVHIYAINDWLHNWLEHYVKPASKQKTYSRYCDIVFQHLIPKFGDTNLEDLTPLVLQQYISELTEHGNLRTGGGLSANTVNAIVTVIQAALQVAYRLGYLPEYTADKVKRPRRRKSKSSVLR